MPKGTEKQKEQQPSNMDVLFGAITKLNEAVDNLSAKLEEKRKIELKAKEESKSPIPEYTSIEQFYPIPAEYENLKRRFLNQEFQLSVTPLSDSPKFQLVIKVPDKYTNMSQTYRDMYHVDLRPIVLDYSAGVPGVQAWMEKVYNSFDSETKAKIAADRI